MCVFVCVCLYVFAGMPHAANILYTHTCAGIPHPATYRRRPFPCSSCHTYMLAYTHHLSLSLSCMLRYATHPHSRTQLAYTHALTYKHLQAALPAALTCSHALIHRYSHSHTLNTLCTRTYSLCVCARARACVLVSIAAILHGRRRQPRRALGSR